MVHNSGQSNFRKVVNATDQRQSDTNSENGGYDAYTARRGKAISLVERMAALFKHTVGRKLRKWNRKTVNSFLDHFKDHTLNKICTKEAFSGMRPFEADKRAENSTRSQDTTHRAKQLFHDRTESPLEHSPSHSCLTTCAVRYRRPCRSWVTTVVRFSGMWQLWTQTSRSR